MSGTSATVNDQRVAFSFVTPAASGVSNYTVSSITVAMLYTSFATPAGQRLQDSMAVFIFASNGTSYPGPGAFVTSGTANLGNGPRVTSINVNTITDVTITFTTPAVLQPNGVYWAMLEFSSPNPYYPSTVTSGTVGFEAIISCYNTSNAATGFGASNYWVPQVAAGAGMLKKTLGTWTGTNTAVLQPNYGNSFPTWNTNNVPSSGIGL